MNKEDQIKELSKTLVSDILETSQQNNHLNEPAYHNAFVSFLNEGSVPPLPLDSDLILLDNDANFEIKDYTRVNAKRKMQSIIQQWSFDSSWKYYISYLGTEDNEFEKNYYFETRWSIPTRRQPIPRATASVYFTFSISKIKPKNHPVEISYVFECWRFVIKSIDQLRFREQWLKQIINNKVRITDMLGF